MNPLEDFCAAKNARTALDQEYADIHARRDQALAHERETFRRFLASDPDVPTLLSSEQYVDEGTRSDYSTALRAAIQHYPGVRTLALGGVATEVFFEHNATRDQVYSVVDVLRHALGHRTLVFRRYSNAGYFAAVISCHAHDEGYYTVDGQHLSCGAITAIIMETS